MLRPLSGNRNEAPDFGAPRGHKGHTLFIVSFLFFSTVLSDLYPLSLSAIPGPSGERTVRIRKVKGSNPSVSTKQKRIIRMDDPFLFGKGGIRIMSAHAGGMCMSQSADWRIPLFLFAIPRKAKRNASESLRLHQNKIVYLTR